MTGPDRPGTDQQEPVVVRDKRRIDPSTGEVREHYATAGEANAPEGSTGGKVDTEAPAPASGTEPALDAVAELTADLQRVTAEYANYRKRVDRDRITVLEMATAALVAELLPVLDDIDRARTHGDLVGPFKGVGEAVEAVTTKLGVERFGEAGDPFDPMVHEAVMQAEPDSSSAVATCAQVFQPGFRLTGGRVLRPARVAVAESGA